VRNIIIRQKEHPWKRDGNGKPLKLGFFKRWALIIFGSAASNAKVMVGFSTLILAFCASFVIDRYEKSIITSPVVQQALEILKNNVQANTCLGPGWTVSHAVTGYDVKLAHAITGRGHPFVTTPTDYMVAFTIWGDNRQVLCLVKAKKDIWELSKDFKVDTIHFDIKKTNLSKKYSGQRRFLVYDREEAEEARLIQQNVNNLGTD